MALEKVINHEHAHAVVGPVYRSNHERIFGKRGFPEEDVPAEQLCTEEDMQGIFGKRGFPEEDVPAEQLCTEEDMQGIDTNARELARKLPPSRLKCSKCGGRMVAKESIELRVCLWCRY